MVSRFAKDPGFLINKQHVNKDKRLAQKDWKSKVSSQEPEPKPSLRISSKVLSKKRTKAFILEDCCWRTQEENSSHQLTLFPWNLARNIAVSRWVSLWAGCWGGSCGVRRLARGAYGGSRGGITRADVTAVRSPPAHGLEGDILRQWPWSAERGEKSRASGEEAKLSECDREEMHDRLQGQRWTCSNDRTFPKRNLTAANQSLSLEF